MTVQDRRFGPDWLPRWELIALAVGDLIALIIFAALGRSSHNMDAGEGPLLAVLNTAAPFAVAWLLTGAAVGLYTGRALYPPGRVLLRTLLARRRVYARQGDIWATAGGFDATEREFVLLPSGGEHPSVLSYALEGTTLDRFAPAVPR